MVAFLMIAVLDVQMGQEEDFLVVLVCHMELEELFQRMQKSLAVPEEWFEVWIAFEILFLLIGEGTILTFSCF